jgi:hypothetical protein
MREMVQQSTSSSTDLAATAEQMSKLSGALLESMGRFVIDESDVEGRRHALPRLVPPETPRRAAPEYTEAGKS